MIFKRTYAYKRKLINRCISRIRSGKKAERTVLGYKTFVFKAMRDVVEKNIRGYLNLLTNSPCRELPEYDEVLSECYIIFDKCLEKYRLNENANFYFYFNKALSRKFYKLYQREIHMPTDELTAEMSTYLPSLRDGRAVDSMDLLFDNLHIVGLEREVCLSRLQGERTPEFLRKHGEVTQAQYNAALRRIKNLLKRLSEGGRY